MHKITLLLFISIIGCTKPKGKILFITSNQHTYGNTKMNTSNHFSEIVYAYDVFIKNGFEVDFVSPKGGAIPIGYIKTSDTIQKKYLYDAHFMNRLKNTLFPKEIVIEEYQAVYYSGGGAAMFGVAENKEIQRITTNIYNKGGIISAVCHGTAGIVNLKNKEGEALYEGKKISGYPDLFERKSADYYKTFPFSIENKIKENKGDFVYPEKRNANFFVIDGNFITGTDPSSTVSVAKAVFDKLQKNK